VGFDGAKPPCSAWTPTPAHISYIAGWTQADPSVRTQAATNVLHAVNAVAAGIGLDELDEEILQESTAA
jgi:hypothetical protein